MTRNDIESQALRMAAENQQSDKSIVEVFWFPDDNEVRLVEVDSTLGQTLSGSVDPFYFSPQPAEQLPAVSAVALIAPGEFGKLRLPANWGGWEDAKPLAAVQ